MFTRILKGDKIPLARLNRGDYFGEQALLGEAFRSRNANVETIEETTLICIEEKYFLPQQEVKEKLKAMGYQQSLNALSVASGFFKSIESLVSQIPNPTIIEMKKNEPIFRIGDQADNVYVILDGKVKLLILDRITKRFNTRILEKGHIFGELGVLKNKLRAGSAVAYTDLRLLSIEGKNFKDYLASNPQVNEIIANLMQTYHIPLAGLVEQYSELDPTLGTSITNIYKMDDGRVIISTNFLLLNSFTMMVTKSPEGKGYQYKKGSYEVELHFVDKKLTLIKALGLSEDLPIYCRILLNNADIEEAELVDFETTGEIKSKHFFTKEKSEVVCPCMSVTKHQLQQQIDQGNRTLEALSAATGVCTVCRSCERRILHILGRGDWLSARMVKLEANTPSTRSYLLISGNGPFKPFKPGQHVTIQAKIDNAYLERPYIISGSDQRGNLRITIEREAKGFFTEWLFDRAPEEFEVNVTHPFGKFYVNPDDHVPAVCFAEGIGITPFITFAKALAYRKGTKRLHIVYSAPQEENFLFTSEFKDVMAKMPTCTIYYKETQRDGSLTDEEIRTIVSAYPNADVYLCGQQGFVDFVEKSLHKIPCNPNKIHSEKIVHAGG